MNKLAILLFLFFSLDVVADCVIKDGSFKTSDATEHLFSIVLSKDMTMHIQHEYWKPGKADTPTVDIIDGTWKCSGSKVTLMYFSFEDIGDYRVMADNPIGVNPELMALYISKSDNLLGGLILTEFEI